MTADRRGGKAKTEETPDERKSDRDMNEVKKKTFQPFLLELKKGKLHIQILHVPCHNFSPKKEKSNLRQRAAAVKLINL